MAQYFCRILVILILISTVSVAQIPLFSFNVSYAQDDEDFEIVEEFEEEESAASEGTPKESASEDANIEDEFSEGNDEIEEFEDDFEEEFSEGDDQIEEFEDDFEDDGDFADETNEIEEGLDEFNDENQVKEEPAIEAEEQQVTDQELQDDIPLEENQEEQVEFDELKETDEPKVEDGLEPQEELQAEEPPMEEPQVEEPEQFEDPNFGETQQASQGFTYDTPNFEYEKALHDIYLNYHSKKTSVEEWNQIFGQRDTESYAIQVGDSLWRISETLFGDGQYWPKVWSLNGAITNPHLIKEGNIINFILGSESDAPSFNVTEAEAASSEEEGKMPPAAMESYEDTGSETDDMEGEVAGVMEIESEIEIPPPLKRSKPVVKKLPPSLPLWQLTQNENNKYDHLGIDYEQRKILNTRDEIPLSTYISENDRDGLGKVIEVEDGNKVASEFQYIYVSVNDGQGEIGESFLVEKSRGKIEKVHNEIKEIKGYAIDVLGEIQLVERVSSLAGSNVFRAIVKKIINPISVGGFLVKDKIRNVPVTDQGPISQVAAEIIGGSYSNKRRVFNTESVAFLNKGSLHGLKLGEVLSVRANRQIRKKDSLIKSNVRPIGWLKVVDVSERVSTAVVVTSWSDIQTGDITGSGVIGMTANFNENLTGTLDEEFDDEASTSKNNLAPEAAPNNESKEGFDEDIDEGF